MGWVTVSKWSNSKSTSSRRGIASLPWCHNVTALGGWQPGILFLSCLKKPIRLKIFGQNTFKTLKKKNLKERFWRKFFSNWAKIKSQNLGKKNNPTPGKMVSGITKTLSIPNSKKYFFSNFGHPIDKAILRHNIENWQCCQLVANEHFGTGYNTKNWVIFSITKNSGKNLFPKCNLSMKWVGILLKISVCSFRCLQTKTEWGLS